MSTHPNRWFFIRVRPVLAALALIAVALPPAASAQAAEQPTAGQPIVTTDMLLIRTVSSIDVSRDGRLAVFSVRSIERSEDGERYAYRSHLFLADLVDERRQPQQITFGARNDHSPALSPNGRWIAFVRAGERSSIASDDEQTGSSQLWLLAVDGGEARQITTLEHGASAPRWSPDGTSILTTMSVPADELEGNPPWPMERPQRQWNDAPLNADAKDAEDAEDAAVQPSVKADPAGTREEIRAWLAQNADKRDPVVINRLNFQGERSLRSPDRFAQLVIVDVRDVDKPVAKQITSSWHSYSGAAYLTSDVIVYDRPTPTGEHPDRVLQRDIWRVDTDGTDDRVLLSEDGWAFSRPTPTRDGSAIAFAGRQLDEPTDRQTRLGVATLDQPGDPQIAWLTDEQRLKGSVGSFAWHPTQTSLLMTCGMRGGTQLLSASPALPEPVSIIAERDGLPIGVGAFDAGGASVVYSEVAVTNPCVVRVRDSRGDRVLLDLNTWVADRALSIPTGGELERADGTKVQYWIMKPTNMNPAEKYPLVLEIHGGPSAMWGPGEASMWHEFQLLCSWGYGVVYANPRGSGGYGYEFQRANYQDWGTGPAGDVLAAVDTAQLQDWVDRDRLFVTGGSYAGYLTAWIVSQDHRFKAAVAQRGVYDLETFFGEGNAWRLLPGEMGGYPWDANVRPVLRRESPFTYVNRIRTPLLIMHASEDLRTGVSQSEMLYRALKVLEREVEYVRYPAAGHDLSRTGDPGQRMDRLNRIIEFFERYANNARPAPVVRQVGSES